MIYINLNDKGLLYKELLQTRKKKIVVEKWARNINKQVTQQ